MRMPTSFACLLGLLPIGCGQPSSPPSQAVATPVAAPKAPAVPDNPEPAEPLADKAKALKRHEVLIELTKRPAANDAKVAFTWTLVAHVPTEEIKPPPGIATREMMISTTWFVTRLTIRAEVMSEDTSFDASGQEIAMPGRLQVGLAVEWHSTYAHGRALGSNWLLPDGSLEIDYRRWPGASLGGDVTGDVPQQKKELFEVAKKPLNKLIKPLLTTEQTFVMPQSVQLLMVEDRPVTLKIK